MRITADVVRQLMEAKGDNVSLVLIAGRPKVIPDVEHDDRYAGALFVTSCEDLLGQVDQRTLSEQDVETLAAQLDTAVSNLGG